MTGSLPAEELLPEVLPAHAVRTMSPQATAAPATTVPRDWNRREWQLNAFMCPALLTRDELSGEKDSAMLTARKYRGYRENTVLTAMTVWT